MPKADPAFHEPSPKIEEVVHSRRSSSGRSSLNGLMRRQWRYLRWLTGAGMEGSGRSSGQRIIHEIEGGVDDTLRLESSVQDDGDGVICCLDAISTVTGKLLWSRCIDHSQSCRMGQAREELEGVVDIILWLQLLGVLAGLGYVVAYRF